MKYKFKYRQYAEALYKVLKHDAGLVNNILERTDRLGIPTYLETFTPRNITFYKRLGYEAVKCFHEPTVDAEYWLMIRDVGNT